MVRLSKRLETIVSAAAEGAAACAREKGNGGGRAPGPVRAADIGTDHGFVPIRLVEMGAVDSALAMDVRKGPLARAREHIREQGLTDRIETRLSDGLAALGPGEAELVVIAGMGGELMLRILREGGHVRPSVRRWVLSPQSEQEIFRRGLEELGLAIEQEVMVEEDGKYYVVMTAVPGTMHYKEEFRYRYGDALIRGRSPVLREYLVKEERQLEAIRSRLASQEGGEARRRLSEIGREILENRKVQGLLAEEEIQHDKM